MTSTPLKPLHTLEEIKGHFAQSVTPIYFISASNFNMMGMHDWVPGWTNINLLDCFDGLHPQVLMVPDDKTQVFQSIEDINLYLLNSQLFRSRLTANLTAGLPPGRALFLFFDPAIEQSCRELQLEIILPANQLVREIDSKIVTTQIGNEAGVSSVPNLLAKVGSYAELMTLAAEQGLGQRLVVQTAFGDSGKTTFFIASKEDYEKVAKKIESEETVKVMRWIRCTQTAIEACATRWGTFVGPLLTELIGAKELTPYAGGWCGNELYPTSFSLPIRQEVERKSRAMGDALYKRGYRGYFELDYLIDQDSGEVYLGELNARITGISAMTNMCDFSANHIPLFLFHLLEYDPEVELTVTPESFNQAMIASGSQGISSQLVLKYTEPQLKIITQAPVSGVYTRGEDNTLTLVKPGYNRREALQENQVYLLRLMMVGEYAYKGGDLGILFLNQVIRGEDGKLNPCGQSWVEAFRKSFDFRNLTQEERSLVELTYNPSNIKAARPT